MVYPFTPNILSLLCVYTCVCGLVLRAVGGGCCVCEENGWVGLICQLVNWFGKMIDVNPGYNYNLSMIVDFLDFFDRAITGTLIP